MSNVLLIYECVEPSNQILYDTLLSTSLYGHFELKQKVCTELTAEDINWCDIIVSIRSTNDYEKRLSRFAKRSGKYWVTMLDDDLLSLGKKYGKSGIGYRKERKRNLVAVLKNTDCLWAVNRLLADKYSAIGGIDKVIFTNTPIDESSLSSPAQNAGKCKIAFYVNDGTSTMFDRYIEPIMPMLCERLSSKIALYLFALHPDLSKYEDKMEIHYVPHMPLNEFKEFFFNSHFDIGLAPVDTEGFSKYKYFNKYIEYTIAGIAGIYTDCDLYRQVVTDGYNGILCDNSPQSWLSSIENLVDNPQYRKSIAENAQQFARENLTRAAIMEKLLADLPELTEYHAPDKKISRMSVSLLKIHYKEFRLREYIAIARAYVISGQTKLLFKKIINKIKK